MESSEDDLDSDLDKERVVLSQIKENKQALIKLLEQARKCVESSDSSDDSEVELSRNMIKEKKEKAKYQEMLQQTINKVHNELEAE